MATEFLLAIMGFYWQLWVFNGYYGFLMVIMGFYSDYKFLIVDYKFLIVDYGFLMANTCFFAIMGF